MLYIHQNLIFWPSQDPAILLRSLRALRALCGGLRKERLSLLPRAAACVGLTAYHGVVQVPSLHGNENGPFYSACQRFTVLTVHYEWAFKVTGNLTVCHTCIISSGSRPVMSYFATQPLCFTGTCLGVTPGRNFSCPTRGDGARSKYLK